MWVVKGKYSTRTNINNTHKRFLNATEWDNIWTYIRSRVCGERPIFRCRLFVSKRVSVVGLNRLHRHRILPHPSSCPLFSPGGDPCVEFTVWVTAHLFYRGLLEVISAQAFRSLERLQHMRHHRSLAIWPASPLHHCCCWGDVGSYHCCHWCPYGQNPRNGVLVSKICVL